MTVVIALQCKELNILSALKTIQEMERRFSVGERAAENLSCHPAEGKIDSVVKMLELYDLEYFR